MSMKYWVVRGCNLRTRELVWLHPFGGVIGDCVKVSREGRRYEKEGDVCYNGV